MFCSTERYQCHPIALAHARLPAVCFGIVVKGAVSLPCGLPPMLWSHETFICGCYMRFNRQQQRLLAQVFSFRLNLRPWFKFFLKLIWFFEQLCLTKLDYLLDNSWIIIEYYLSDAVLLKLKQSKKPLCHALTSFTNHYNNKKTAE